jgi:AcrR family transcriptional regulator
MKGATTRRIAEAAKAPLASLHYRFHTKEDLFFSVFEYMSTGMVEMQVDDVVPTQDDLATTAVHLMQSVRDWSLANPIYTKVQFDLTLWATQQGLGARVYQVFLDSFAKVLAGALGPAAEPAVVEPIARLITSLLDGLSLQWVSDANDERFRADTERAGEMIATYINGLEIPATAVASAS